MSSRTVAAHGGWWTDGDGEGGERVARTLAEDWRLAGGGRKAVDRTGLRSLD